MRLSHTGRVVGVMLCLVLWAGAAQAESPADHYRWTGKGADALWRTAANWQVQQDEQWQPASTPPDRHDTVHLGDASADEPQTILLDRDQLVGQLIIAPTGQRAYTLTSMDQTLPCMYKAGELPAYRLWLTGHMGLVQEPIASQRVTLDVEVGTLHPKVTNMQLNSDNGAEVVFGRTVTAGVPGHGTRLQISTDAQAPHGALVFRDLMEGDGVTFSGDLSVVFDPLPEVDVLMQPRRGMVAHGATFTFRRSTKLGRGLSPRGHTIHLRVAETVKDELVEVELSGFGRDGQVIVDPLPPGVQLALYVGHLSISGFDSSPELQLPERAVLHLTGDQESPSTITESSGIHGAGGLVRDHRRDGYIGERNTYTGGTWIRQGTLQLKAVELPVNDEEGAPKEVFRGQLGPGMLYLAPGGALALNGAEQTVSGLADTDGSLAWPPAAVMLEEGALVVDSEQQTTFSGQLHGPGTFRKEGRGILVLSAESALDQLTAIELGAGTLTIQGNWPVDELIWRLAGGILRANQLTGPSLRIALVEPGQEPALQVAQADIVATDLHVSLEGTHPPGTVFPLLRVADGLSGERLFKRQPGEVIQVGESALRLRLIKQRDLVLEVVEAVD